MIAREKRNSYFFFSSILLFVTAAAMGITLGLALALNKNISNLDNLTNTQLAIPSKLLDINGELITEFFSDEKREIVPLDSVPNNQIQALLTREDDNFFDHNGVSIRGFFRALFNNLLYVISPQRGFFSGFSTLTMQMAGTRHDDRSNISVSRKLREIWWAFQLERRFTKHEILEQYLNSMYFGHNTYGIEAASQFFFGHSVVENTPAESVMLVIQLAAPNRFSPLINPALARSRQKHILGQMVNSGYFTRTEADSSYEAYWTNFDWSRPPTDSPYFNRLARDKAPYFSEYIRNEVQNYLFGQQNVYRDGYTIHTTLNLEYQRKADRIIEENLELWNRNYINDRTAKFNFASRELIDIIELISLSFGAEDLRIAGSQDRKHAIEFFRKDIVPVMDMLSMTLGIPELKTLSNLAYEKSRRSVQKNTVQTALITLDNENGHILAMLGGSEFNRNNQYNRATDGKLMPGSAFKPLYFSEAINSGIFTASSLVNDSPRSFTSPNGESYTPSNYNGLWAGPVLIRDSLARSLNIPAIIVLENIGFDAAIEKSASLLGIENPEEIKLLFPKVYPLGLGISTVSPLQLARAYATIANRGNTVEPISIRYIEDRYGNIIANPERELRESQMKRNNQIISPQAAYIMTSMLQSVVKYGTLAGASARVGGFGAMPIAGKTGTTQNWSDAWTIGYSPYVTTALWIGFDRRGNSLGKFQTGASATGPVWAKYMKTIHEDLPVKQFSRPQTGLVNVPIDRKTGMLPGENTPDKQIRYETFITGTEPSSEGYLRVFEEFLKEEQVIKIAVDSSLNNTEETTNSTNFTRELFSELGLESTYLEEDSPQELTDSEIQKILD